MKKHQLLTLAVAVMSAAMTTFGQEYTYLFNSGLNNAGAVPDANPNGLVLTADLTGMAGYISSVNVSLDLSGGFNGDLYAYLVGPDGGFAVLLNRVGMGDNADPFGYSDSGMNVTFSDTAANDIHNYQNVPSYSLDGTTWQPDGINIDPQSSPAAFLSAGQTAMLGSFENDDPNGTWTLFLADLSPGGQSTVAGWGLDITTVPEPSTWALLICGSLIFARRILASGSRKKIA